MNNDKLKIAVCMSGLIRTGCNAYPNLINFFGELLPNIDFFIHTWDLEKQKNPDPNAMDSDTKIWDMLNSQLPYKLTNSKIKKITELYNPKYITVDNFESELHNRSTHLSNKDIAAFKFDINLWNSAYKSNQLKIKYENLHNFKYDIVIKLRPDVLISPKKKLSEVVDLLLSTPKNTILVEFSKKNTTPSNTSSGDIVFLGRSEEMDSYVNFGNIYNRTQKTLHTPIELANSNNLNLIGHQIRRTVLYRDISLHLDPILDFNAIDVDGMRIYASN
jgi:hypothetical protein